MFGSRTCSYRTAIGWATVTTFTGSLAAMFLAQELLKRFSGKGLVPDELAASPGFVVAVALGAGLTVLLATQLGFPISTTHGLTGALVGAGLVAVGGRVNLAALGKSFVLPLLLSPLLAVALGAIVYLAARLVRRRLGISKEMCICGAVEEGASPAAQPDGVAVARSLPRLTVTVDETSA